MCIVIHILPANEILGVDAVPKGKLPSLRRLQIALRPQSRIQAGAQRYVCYLILAFFQSVRKTTGMRNQGRRSFSADTFAAGHQMRGNCAIKCKTRQFRR